MSSWNRRARTNPRRPRTRATTTRTTRRTTHTNATWTPYDADKTCLDVATRCANDPHNPPDTRSSDLDLHRPSPHTGEMMVVVEKYIMVKVRIRAENESDITLALVDMARAAE